MKIEIELRRTEGGYCVIDASVYEAKPNGHYIRSISWKSNRRVMIENVCLVKLPAIIASLFDQPGHFRKAKLK